MNFLMDKEIDLTLIAGPDHYWDTLKSEVPAKCVEIDIPRNISLANDIKALWKMFLLFRKEQFDIVHSITPKGGLVTSLAGFFAGVPVRIHSFTGQRWDTITGPKKKLLIFIDKIVCALNNQIYADSPSQRQFLIDMGIVDPHKIKVINKGSLGGIDLEKFQADKFEKAKIPFVKEESLKLLYVGRINRDKGINELVEAINIINKDGIKVELVLVGDYEHELSPLDSKTLEKINECEFIHDMGFAKYPQEYFKACDLFCLPSYREGFGTVVIEAAAFKKATIGTNIKGLKDAIVDGKTGVLVNPGDVNSIVEAVEIFLANSVKMNEMGENAYSRVVEDFDWKVIADEQYSDYIKLIK